MHDVEQGFPFVVGCARSGTSLLRAMLDSHPEMAVPTESHFIPKFVGSPSVLAQRLPNDRNFMKWGIAVPGLEDVRDYSEAVRRVYASYAAAQGKPRYGDKTPAYVLHIPFLARLFPESRFIHVIRDGRDTALSLLDVGFGPSTLEEAALRWRRYVSAGRNAGRALPGRYLEVLYERLVDDAEATLRVICDYLDLHYSPAMLEYPRRIEALRPTASATDHLRHRPIRTRDWRLVMSHQQAERFERIAGDVLTEFGFEASFSPGLRQRLERARARGAHVRSRGRAIWWAHTVRASANVTSKARRFHEGASWKI